MTTITVQVRTTEINGMPMTEVIGLIGTGKKPIAKIVMGTFPKGCGSAISVISAWKKNNPDVKFEYGYIN
jgi:hypothetical protein